MRFITYDLGSAMRAGFMTLNYVADIEKASKALSGLKMPASLKALFNLGSQGLEKLKVVDQAIMNLVTAIEQGREKRPTWLIPDNRVHLCAPIPDPGKILCLGLNYLDHVREQEGRLGRSIEPPQTPVIFSKFATALTGPYDPIILPPPNVTKQVDYEVELALVIGQQTKGVSQKKAMASVVGVMIMNDVSARDCQFADKQWVRAKSFDTFAPCGPWIVTCDELNNLHKLKLQCVVNGDVRQQGTTKDMLFKLPYVIEFLSQAITLEPGDIISTGTPAGVGIFQEPPRLLQRGDTVECSIEAIGTICNHCE